MNPPNTMDTLNIHKKGEKLVKSAEKGDVEVARKMIELLRESGPAMPPGVLQGMTEKALS